MDEIGDAQASKGASPMPTTPKPIPTTEDDALQQARDIFLDCAARLRGVRDDLANVVDLLRPHLPADFEDRCVENLLPETPLVRMYATALYRGARDFDDAAGEIADELEQDAAWTAEGLQRAWAEGLRRQADFSRRYRPGDIRIVI